MSLVNLLAFFQIAVAFDFGLLFLSRTHIFPAIHSSLMEELNDWCETTVIQAEMACEETYESTTEGIIRERVCMTQILDKLYNHLTPRHAIWNKYSYIGLFSGIYGLLCLFLIGLSGCEYDHRISQFLLISAEVTIFFQVMALIMIGKSKDRFLSVLKVGLGLLGLAAAYLFSFIFAWSGSYIPWFADFNVPFLVMSILIAYMPVFVYLWRLAAHVIKFLTLSHDCETQYTLLQRARGKG